MTVSVRLGGRSDHVTAPPPPVSSAEKRLADNNTLITRLPWTKQ